MNIKLCAAMLLSCIILSGCGGQVYTTYRSENIEVERDGEKTAVYDLTSGNIYNYTSKRVKRSESVTEPYTSVNTDTVKVDIIPGGMKVHDKAANTIFTIRRKIRR